MSLQASSKASTMRISTVARKLIMGVTGLMLVGFMITHLAGNLLIFMGKDALNAYSTTLHSIKGFVLVELGLAGIFLLHIATAISLIRDNRRARPVDYERRAQTITLASRLMPVSGAIVMVFLVVHIITMRFGPHETHRDKIYGVVMDLLTQPAFAIFYLVGVLLLGPHLRHGIQSSLRSLGLTHKSILAKLDVVSIVLAALLTIGFAIIPVWILVTKG